MSQNVRMIIDNLWDSAALSVTAGTIVPTLPISHSQKYGRSKTAAITPDSNHQSVITFNLASLSLVSGLVFYRHWLSVGATWRLELFDGIDQGGESVFDSGDIEMIPTKTLGELNWLTDNLVASAMDDWEYKFSQLWFGPAFAFSGRLTITDADSQDGLHEFDRVYLGHVIQPQFNFNYGHQHQWQSRTIQKQTAGGSIYGVEKATRRQLTLELAHIREEERPHLSNAIRKVGLHRDWFISMYPEHGGIKELEYAMACKFDSLPGLDGNYHHNYRTTFSIQEA